MGLLSYSYTKMSILLETTLELLHSTRHPVRVISEKTGVGYWLISRLRGSNPPMPSVDACERLYTFLADQPLDLTPKERTIELPNGKTFVICESADDERVQIMLMHEGTLLHGFLKD